MKDVKSPAAELLIRPDHDGSIHDNCYCKNKEQERGGFLKRLQCVTTIFQDETAAPCWSLSSRSGPAEGPLTPDNRSSHDKAFA